MHSNNNDLRKLLFTLFVFTNLGMILAQRSGTISGIIMDGEIEGEPLVFAHVSLKNTSWATQTNFHGNFTLSDVEPGEYTLVISYLGYENLETYISVKIGKTTTIEKSLSALSIDSIKTASLPARVALALTDITGNKTINQ